MSYTKKDNLILLAGISLPLVIVLIFILAVYIPKQLVESPKHDMLYVTNYNSGCQKRVRFDVVRKHVRVRLYKEVKEDRCYDNNLPRLYKYSAATNTSKEIELDYGDAFEKEDKDDEYIVILIKALDDIKLTTTKKSPDGYEATYRSRRSGGLVGGLFGHYRTPGGLILKKDSNTINVTESGSYYSTKFIGWVIK